MILVGDVERPAQELQSEVGQGVSWLEAWYSQIDEMVRK
jgi:hypothetical protein